LVTGAAGFIGSHVVDLLLEEGHKVVCFVMDGENLRWLEGKDVIIVRGDCTDKVSIYSALDGNIDYIFHLAAVMRAKEPHTYFDVNYGGTKNLVESCIEKKLNLKRFVYTSSVAAAGPSGTSGRLRESDPCRPVNDYGRSKVSTENLLKEHGSIIPFTILRPSLVYGPRNRKTNFSYFQLVSWGVKPLIGEGFTNVIYVKDLARYLVLAAKSDRAAGQTYFVGEEKIYSYRELADTIASIMGKRTITLRVPMFALFFAGAVLGFLGRVTRTSPLFDLRRYSDIKYRYWMYDTSKIVKDLGYSPEYRLEDGIRETIEWYRTEGWIR
ncbi:MAG: NAD-dependent epimerase/dehydratase family protein, partial [Spirochaetota bacterium]